MSLRLWSRFAYYSKEIFFMETDSISSCAVNVAKSKVLLFHQLVNLWYLLYIRN